MSTLLLPPQRVRLRRYLIDHFSPGELKDLAFELGVDHDLFRLRTEIELSRELLAFCERRGRLACLVRLALALHPNEGIQQLLVGLAPCPPHRKLQLEYYDDLIPDELALRHELAAHFQIGGDDLTLIAAAGGSTRLLVGVPEKSVPEENWEQLHTDLREVYRYTALEAYDELGGDDQKTWRYIAIVHPPDCRNRVLRPVISWRAARATSRIAPSSLYPIYSAVLATLKPVMGDAYRALEFTLDRGQTGPLVRRGLIYASLVLIWILLVVVEGISPTPIPEYLIRLFRYLRLGQLVDFAFLAAGEPLSLRHTLFQIAATFFDLQVLRHLLWVYLAWRIAFHSATLYLMDLFELDDRQKAHRHLSSAVLGGRYHKLTIDGPLPDPNNPLIRIGGPGYVNTFLEWSALFETIDNQPHVIEAGRSFIKGFERLREVVSVKDQLGAEEDVTEYSKDGVPVTAQDVQILFSIDRAGLPPRFPDRPYPVRQGAIERIIYGQHITAERGLNWTDRLMDTITSELRRFVAEHPLHEFLAEPPETTTFTPESTRRAITASFYDPRAEVQRRIRELSNSLVWINVGTWTLPEEIESDLKKVSDKYIDTWRLSWVNRFRKRREYQDMVRKEARVAAIQEALAELLEVVQVVPPDNKVFDPPFLRSYLRQLLTMESDQVVGANLPRHFDELTEYLNTETAHVVGQGP